MQAWFVITVLILILLAVALLDWLETRLYAQAASIARARTRRIAAPSLWQACAAPSDPDPASEPEHGEDE